MRAPDFSGGEATVARVLKTLGFAVEGPRPEVTPLPSLVAGRVYSWNELETMFQFSSGYLGAAGGMVSRPAMNALLLITHPGGAKSFDYEDRWEDDKHLVYTGRGKTGDQRLEGPNRDVAENRKHLLVFEAAGTHSLRFVGEATCTDKWPARALGADGNERDVWKFRLAFTVTSPTSTPASGSTGSTSPLRRPRLFSGSKPSSSRQVRKQDRATPEEIAALQEKANNEHRSTLDRLAALLSGAGWTEVEEIPAAVDLWATDPVRRPRVIFEVKTLSGSNEVHQCRAALAQLLEYRFFFGKETDRLCIVLTHPIADRRRALLEQMGVAIVVIAANGEPTAVGNLAHEWFGPTPWPRQASPHLDKC